MIPIRQRDKGRLNSDHSIERPKTEEPDQLGLASSIDRESASAGHWRSERFKARMMRSPNSASSTIKSRSRRGGMTNASAASVATASTSDGHAVCQAAGLNRQLGAREE
jgi:hypothetical protein